MSDPVLQIFIDEIAKLSKQRDVITDRIAALQQSYEIMGISIADMTPRWWLVSMGG